MYGDLYIYSYIELLDRATSESMRSLQLHRGDSVSSQKTIAYRFSENDKVDRIGA